MPAAACAPRRRCSAAPSSSPLPPASSSTSSTPDHQGEPTMTDQLTELVRERYASAALSVLTPEAAPCCADEGEAFGAGLYDADADTLPEAARLASLGCGNPIAVAELHEGERVLDLGSGGGIDVLLSARRVGPSGRGFGLDMFAEMARVLRPGGRIGISDVVADDDLAPAQRAERGSYVGCIAGALSFAEYRAGLEGVGFRDVTVTPTHAVADGMWSAIVRAVRTDAPVASS